VTLEILDSLTSLNAQRNADLEPPYNPVSGFGDACGQRDPVCFSFGKKQLAWNIPVAMLTEPLIVALSRCGSVDRLARQAGCTPPFLFNEIVKLRCRHDFEFWAATCAKIQDKVTKKLINFRLNKPQRKLLAVMLQLLLDQLPVRVIICKARQWGGSTLVQLFMQWIQIFHHSRWHSVIATDVEMQARTIRGMFTRVAKNHPPAIASITVANFEGSAKNKLIRETDTIISIGSMQMPDSLRSQDIMMAHLSEIGLWKKTEGKQPEDLIQTIVGSIPYVPGTVIVEESTAKGVGNYFHRAFKDALAGRSNSKPVFVAWYEIAMYRKAISPDHLPDLVQSFSDYEKFLWQSGATLEGIAWYRDKLKEFKGDVWRMQSEFPTTPDEAFQSNARRVFSPVYVKSAEQYVTEPTMTGELTAKERTGPNALLDVRFAQQPGGCLKVWITPAAMFSDDGEPVRIEGRFCAFLDIGGRTAKADYSVLTIIDRAPMLKGLPVELAARWKGHTDQDILAWKAAMCCAWYENALLAVEIQSLDRDDNANTGGDHSSTILDEIALHYNNLYHRTSVEDIRANIPRKWGFSTTRANKVMIIDALNAAIRDTAYIERDWEAIAELNSYEEKENGKMGNVDGAHDDIVMSTAGAVWLATSYMPPPRIVKIKASSAYKRTLANEASYR
jgi:hypothetical protein